jgi:hypothetical protein
MCLVHYSLPVINSTADFFIEKDDKEPNCHQTIGTAQDLIYSAQASDSIEGLNGLNFSITYDNLALLSYSTDEHAWDITSGQQFCSKLDGYLFATMKFGLASTEGTFCHLHMNSNGHGTYINIDTGVKIWHTITPKPGKSFAEAFGCIDPFKDYDVKQLNSQDWDIETIILQDGMRLCMIISCI